jgi:uncharacterized protein YkwD
MARAGRLEHELPSARYPRAEDRLKAVQYSWQAWGENVAFGQEHPESVMRTWMTSSVHRDNILGAAYTEMGAGYAQGKDGRAYWVQVFGRPLS